ncbi:MAG: hypothetical protein ACLFTK_14625 [Anaerolineales bacterium]
MTLEQINFATITHTDPVDLGYDVTARWIAPGRIFQTTLHSMAPESIDTYIATNLQLTENWDSRYPMLILNDLSAPTITMTPYFRNELKRIARTAQEAPMDTHAAIVLQNGIVHQMMKLFALTFGRLSDSKQQFFTDYDDAVASLHALREAHNAD